MGSSLLFGLVLFLSSAGGLIVEIVAGRLIAPYVGMSLYTWTAIIAVVLAGLSIGHWVGGRMAGPHVDRPMGLRRLAIALALAGATSLLALVILADLAMGLLSSGLGQVTVVVLLTTALFLLPSFFVGMVAPIVTKLAVDARPDDTGGVLGRMFALGTAGSIAGTLGAGYLFISWIGSSGTLIAVTALYFVMSVLCAGAAGRTGRKTVAALILLPIAPLLILGGARGAFAERCTMESDYFCVIVDDFSPATGRPSALMVLDNLVHSINDREDPSLLYSPYIHFVDEYARRRFPLGVEGLPFSAFFVGGGGYTLPRSWAATVDGARLVVAEIDPAVTQVAEERLWLNAEAEGLDIRHGDARRILQATPRAPSFDVVFGDAFHDISVPAHLVSREFHQEVAARLRPEGFYVVNVVDAAEQPLFLASLSHTLGLDFEHVAIWRETTDTDIQVAEGRVTYVVVASPTDLPITGLQSAFGIDRAWRRLETAAVISSAEVEPVVLTDDFAPVDRLLSRVLFAGAE